MLILDEASAKVSSRSERPVERDESYEPGRPTALELYRWAVQDPETHATLLRVVYERLRPGHTATVLREDFAGTAADSAAWVALKNGRRALAVDLDATTVAWARARAQRLLGRRADGLDFVVGDSLEVGPSPKGVDRADIVSVLNFSILYLREEALLRAYLRHAYERLSESGLLVLNLFGGPAAVRPGTTRHRVEPTPRLPTEVAIAPFDYLWEVKAYDAASRRVECAIHFELADGSRLHDAFQYEWRLWTPEELIEACLAAGFSNAKTWRHTYDPSKGADGVFLGPVASSTLDSLDQWTAYIVATR